MMQLHKLIFMMNIMHLLALQNLSIKTKCPQLNKDGMMVENRTQVAKHNIARQSFIVHIVRSRKYSNQEPTDRCKT